MGIENEETPWGKFTDRRIRALVELLNDKADGCQGDLADALGTASACIHALHAKLGYLESNAKTSTSLVTKIRGRVAALEVEIAGTLEWAALQAEQCEVGVRFAADGISRALQDTKSTIAENIRNGKVSPSPGEFYAVQPGDTTSPIDPDDKSMKAAAALRETLAQISSGEATGAIVMALNDYGLLHVHALVPDTRDAVSDAAHILSICADRYRSIWYEDAVGTRSGPSLHLSIVKEDPCSPEFEDSETD